MAIHYFKWNFFSGEFFSPRGDGEVWVWPQQKLKKRTFKYPDDRAEIRRILLQQLHPERYLESVAKEATIVAKKATVYSPDYETAKLLEQFLDDEESITLLLLQ